MVLNIYGWIKVSAVDITDGTEDGKMEFLTMKAGTETSTLMLNSGNVGIGQVSPSFPLHVKGSYVAYGGQLVIEDSADPTISFRSTNANTAAGLLGQIGYSVTMKP